MQAELKIRRWVRVGLVMLTLLLIGVFILAASLNPYDQAGQARRLETHRQLGMPRCTFYDWAGTPCPSCGMTTSFCLLIRGDIGNSLKANSAGTLLAVFLLLVIPWAGICSLRGRLYGIRSLELSVTVVVAILLVVMLARWGLVLAFGWNI